MKITAKDLRALDIIDDIVPEPLGGAHRDPAEAAHNLERHIVRTLRELARVPVENLIAHRYDRWRRMGKFVHAQNQAAPKAGEIAKLQVVSTVGGSLRLLDPWTGEVIECMTQAGERLRFENKNDGGSL